MSMKMKLLSAAAGLAAMGLSAGIANAAAITSNLVIIDGDKKFFNFSCTDTGGGNCNNVDVIASSNPSLNGIVINPTLAAFNGGVADVTVSYDVLVLDPNFKIDQIQMVFNGSVNGSGLASITETAFGPGDNIPDGQLIVSQTDLSDPPFEVFDLELNGAYTILHIVKDMFVAASGCPSNEESLVACNNFATISYVEQLFRQTDSVPEPMTLGLLGAGLLGMGIAARRRRS